MAHDCVPLDEVLPRRTKVQAATSDVLVVRLVADLLAVLEDLEEALDEPLRSALVLALEDLEIGELGTRHPLAKASNRVLGGGLGQASVLADGELLEEPRTVGALAERVTMSIFGCSSSSSDDGERTRDLVQPLAVLGRRGNSVNENVKRCCHLSQVLVRLDLESRDLRQRISDLAVGIHCSKGNARRE